MCKCLLLHMSEAPRFFCLLVLAVEKNHFEEVLVNYSEDEDEDEDAAGGSPPPRSRAPPTPAK